MRPFLCALSGPCIWLACARGSMEPATVAPDAAIAGPGDRDQDGVPDALDDCPESRGANYRGCPVHDRDLEASLESVDHCIDHSETRNGYEDDDGCPDELPPSLCCGPEAYIPPIHVPAGSRLSDRVRVSLDRVGEFLVERPRTPMLLIGHAHPREGGGKPAAQRALGLARAEAARKYLVERWRVDPTSLTTSSPGADEPHDTNKTERGRANNRRVEFVFLVADPTPPAAGDDR